MSSNVLMPQLGETVAEGKILNWFKSVGDHVAEGDNLFEIETDKVTMEVQSIVEGKLSDIKIKAGEVALVGAVVATIGGPVTTASAPQTSSGVAPHAPYKEDFAQRPVAAQQPPAQLSATKRSPFDEVATPAEAYGRAKGPLGLRMTPLARRLIAQNGLDANAIAQDVKAAGGSRIAERDVEAALVAAKSSAAAQTVAPPPATVAPKAVQLPQLPGSVVTLNTIRKRTGERLAQNWQTIPHVFQAVEVDFTGVETARATRKEAFKAETGLSLTYLPFIVRATCIALKEFPEVNSRFAGDSLQLSQEVNLGIAVDLSHDGLVVPVVRNADDLTLPGLAKAIGRQVGKARAGKLTGDDFAGGTYSISNNGAFGTSFTVPIINAPQVAILSTDAIRMRPAVVETPHGLFVAPRLTGMVGQSFDHRAFDGAYSAAFLSRLKAILEERDWSAEFA